MRPFIFIWMIFALLLSFCGNRLNAMDVSEGSAMTMTGPRATPWDMPRDTPDEPMNLPYDNSRMGTVDGIRMHYRHWEQPEGERKGSCLLLHGFGASTFSWQEVADSLHQLGYEVVAVDLPPFGYSDKSDGINQSVTAHALRVKKLTEEDLPGRKWHLAGHSMGGSVAQAFALQYPEHLRSVTFVAAALFSTLEDEPRPARALLRLSPLRFLLGELAEEWVITPRRVEDMLESAYGTPPEDRQVEAYLYPLQIPGTGRAILAAATFHEELTTLDAAELQVPALAIWGDADTWVPVERRKRALERMPDTELIMLEGVGHNPMETHFNDYMRSWIPFLEAHDN